MRLKKLSIIGFKSFADKTVLRFDQGITCIVGPNGCGKSNISDAFRWVLGEQSAKSLRGHKMPDVIFAGTSQRKPLNFAEVSLTLTDVKGTLPIDYEELTLTRRLHRSGESEYFINGNLVRLKDVQSLFLDSGVGRNAFSIFEQGKLDQVISYSPLERRYIFEEAAGILRFLQRKREALKRLEQADGNFSRVRDIHQEVEKQILLLQQQAEKALQFKKHKNQLETFEKSLYLLRWKSAEKKKASLYEKSQKIKEVLDENKEFLLDCRQSMLELKGVLQTKEKALKLSQEGLFKVSNEKEIHLLENQANQKRVEELKRKETKLKNEWEGLALSKQTRSSQIQKIEAQQKNLSSEFQQIESTLDVQQSKVKSKEKEVSDLRLEMHLKQQSHGKSLQEESRCVSEMKQSEIRLENFQERKEQLKSRQDLIAYEIEIAAQVIHDKKKQLQQVSSLVDSHKERMDYYEEELERIAKDLEGKHRDLDQQRRKVIESKTRQKILLKMREELEGFSTGTKKLLQASQNENSPFYKKLRPLYEFLNPKSEAAEAVAVILRVYGQTLVVEKHSDFEEVIAFAEKEGLQDFSLICSEFLAEKSEPVKAHSLLGQVSMNPIAGHFLQHAGSADSLSEALQMIEGCDWKEIWTVGGFYVDQRKVFFKIKPGENQVFIRESELKNLEEELNLGEEQLRSLEQKLALLRQSKGQLELERAETDKMLRRDEMKLVEVNFGLKRALGDLEKYKTEQAAGKEKSLALEQQIEEQKTNLNQLEQAQVVLSREVLRLGAEWEGVRTEVGKQEEILHLYLQEHQEKGALYRQLSEHKQQLVHQLQLLEMQEQEHDNQAARLTEELEESEDQLHELRKREAKLVEALVLIEKKLVEAKEAYHKQEIAYDELKVSREALEETIAGQEEQLKKSEAEFTQIKIVEAQIETTLEGLRKELKERFDLMFEQLDGLEVPDQSIEQIEKSIRAIKLTIQAAGDINLSAIEDLEKLQVRFDFLGRQLEDMLHSKEELLQIISQLDGESRKLFKDTFETIRENFKKNFQILFSGGEADLQFTENDDILEAGIEISAKPPGKQMRSISLLSGGEKCLTAVALLFAIFEVKPAPFCILDEIDAPLDDSNVERFVNVVKHFADRCQFLIITHNKRTMAIGDIIFGVSMEEKGISKLLSLEFAHENVPDVALI
ncbi:MAG: chromosome segregation protein SMC [Candidatus Protochlamydia sp.]|nr:chromosome segregation protein SMC [Candidatus Protochlamydia sp.]